MIKKIKKMITEDIGWYGTIAILTAYALLNFSIISANSLSYQILNGTGALAIVYHSFKKKDYQPGVLNVMWFILAMIGIIRIIITSN